MSIESQFSLQGSEALKTVFRNHASGIALVTSVDDAGNPIGFTASSITSLGSNPPLVSFNIAQGSSSYCFLLPGKLVAMHTLDETTLHLAQRLAGDKAQRFDGSESRGPEGIPLFEQSSAILLGRIRERFEVESNAVIVLDAVSARLTGTDVNPLVYFQRAYHGLGDKLADNS